MEIDKKIIKKLIEALEDLKKSLKDKDVINNIKSSVEEEVKSKITEATVSHAETVAKSVKKVKGNARAAIERLSGEGNAQAAHIWNHIKDNDMNEDQIRALVNSKNFFSLLGKIA